MNCTFLGKQSVDKVYSDISQCSVLAELKCSHILLCFPAHSRHCCSLICASAVHGDHTQEPSCSLLKILLLYQVTGIVGLCLSISCWYFYRAQLAVCCSPIARNDCQILSCHLFISMTRCTRLMSQSIMGYHMLVSLHVLKLRLLVNEHGIASIPYTSTVLRWLHP